MERAFCFSADGGAEARRRQYFREKSTRKVIVSVMRNRMEASEINRLLRAYSRDGSEDAFVQLVKHYSGLVFGVASQTLGSHSKWAEDVCQEVFITLAQQAESILDATHLAAWLHRVTARAAIDRLRSESKRSEREKSFSMEESIHSSPSPVLLRGSLDDTLSELKPADRRLIALRFFEDMDISAIGSVLGISEGTARARMRRALDRLRHRLLLRGVTCSTVMVTTALARTPASESITSALVAKWSGTALATLSPAGTPPATLLLKMTAKTKILMATACTAVIVVLGTLAIQRTSPGNEGSSQQVQRSEQRASSSPSGARKTAGERINFISTQRMDDLLEQARILCQENPEQNKDSLLESLSSLLAEIPVSQIPDALDKVRDFKGPRTQILLNAALLGVWARKDGGSAMAYAIRHLRKTDGAHPITYTMEAWSGMQPEEAVSWLLEPQNRMDLEKTHLPAGKAVLTLENHVCKRCISIGRYDLVARLAAGGGDESVSVAGIMLARHVDSPETLTRIADSLATLPADERIPVLAKTVSELARSRSIRDKDIRHWIQSVKSPSEKAEMGEAWGPVLIRNIVASELEGSAPDEGESRTDIPEIASWTLSHQITPEQRQRVIARIVNSWTFDDPVHPRTFTPEQLQPVADWLTSNARDSEESDLASAKLAISIGKYDEESALQWAHSITDGFIRTITLKRLEHQK